MVKAKAARKWHAARRRWWERNPPTITVTFHFDATALKAALFGASQAADEAAAAMRQLSAAAATAGRVIEGQARRVPRVVLAPGRLFARLPGGELQHLGQTGQLVLERSQPVFCGVCGQAIRHDPWTGTTCACAQGAP